MRRASPRGRPRCRKNTTTRKKALVDLIRRVELRPMLGGEGDVSEHVGFSVVHAVAQLRPAGAELVGDMPPGLHRRGVTWLEEDLPDRSRHHGCLALGHVRQRIPHEVNARQRCQVAPTTRVMAFFNPSWASEITSFTPLSPRLARSRRKVVQKGSASEGPMCRPTISRLPSVVTATAIMAATETMRPPSRTLR